MIESINTLINIVFGVNNVVIWVIVCQWDHIWFGQCNDVLIVYLRFICYVTKWYWLRGVVWGFNPGVVVTMYLCIDRRVEEDESVSRRA